MLVGLLVLALTGCSDRFIAPGRSSPEWAAANWRYTCPGQDVSTAQSVMSGGPPQFHFRWEDRSRWATGIFPPGREATPEELARFDRAAQQVCGRGT